MFNQARVDTQTRACVLACWTTSILWITLPLVSSSLPSLTPPSLPSLLPLLPSSIAACAILTLGTFTFGLLTGNVSQVDKVWSLAPPLYSLLIHLTSPSPRSLILLLLAASWGVRLTYNFWRRGGYAWPLWRGEEDYRWNFVRKWPVLNTKLGWHLFHLGFICIYQNLLLLSLALPSLYASAGSELNYLDLLATVTFLLLLLIESVADQQQWEFQTEKHALLRRSENLPLEFSAGFPTLGLFSISRHPNYVAEQLLWVVYYLFSVAGTGHWFNPSITGSILLIVLFQGSTLLSEGISSGRHPAYLDYKKIVPRFLGNFWRLAPSYPTLQLQPKLD